MGIEEYILIILIFYSSFLKLLNGCNSIFRNDYETISIAANSEKACNINLS